MNVQRLLWGFVVALLIASLGLAALRLGAQLTGTAPSLPDGAAIMLTAILLVLVYVIAAIIWRNFLSLLDREHSWKNIIIDIGLLSIGKYFPGKVIGLLTRGSITNDGIQISARSALFSFSEQIMMLVSGFWFGCLLAMLAICWGSPLKQFAAVTVWIVVLPSTVRFTVWLLRHVPVMRRLSHGELPVLARNAALRLGLGHSAMWLTSALSLLPLVSGSFSEEQILLVMGVYVISTLAGWLAIVAPAGIGVREAVFATLLVSVVPLEQTIPAITWHRILCVGVDIFFGSFSLFLFFLFRTRHQPTSSQHD